MTTKTKGSLVTNVVGRTILPLPGLEHVLSFSYRDGVGAKEHELDALHRIAEARIVAVWTTADTDGKRTAMFSAEVTKMRNPAHDAEHVGQTIEGYLQHVRLEPETKQS